jgi:hypothetical protein
MAPIDEDSSTRQTGTPLSARSRAAVIPAIPPPIINTCFGASELVMKSPLSKRFLGNRNYLFKFTCI